MRTSISVTNGDLIDNDKIQIISKQSKEEIPVKEQYSYTPVTGINYVSIENQNQSQIEDTCQGGCNVSFKDCEELKPLPQQDTPLLRKNYLSEYKSELDRKIVLSNLGITFDNDKLEKLSEQVTNNSEKLSTIEEYAEKNVQSDWNETDETSDSFILNKPNFKNRVVLELPAYEPGEYLPIMSWRAYEDPYVGLRYITKNKYHFLIAFSSNESLSFDALLQQSGNESISPIKQYFYNKGWGVTVPFFMTVYHPNGIVDKESRIIIGFKPQLSTSIERPIYLIPLSLDMPDFRWENPKEKLDINNGKFRLQENKFTLSFPNAQMRLRVNGGQTDVKNFSNYVPTGAGRDINLKTNDTIDIDCENTGQISMDWEFQVKKVPNQLSINEKPYDGSKELEIEVADTPLTTQEILSILI